MNCTPNRQTFLSKHAGLHFIRSLAQNVERKTRIDGDVDPASRREAIVQEMTERDTTLKDCPTETKGRLQLGSPLSLSLTNYPLRASIGDDVLLLP